MADKPRPRTRPPGPALPPATIAHLRAWIVGFVVCSFDVDIGPTVETIYPFTPALSGSDLSRISFNCFPERHDSDAPDTQLFFFTVGAAVTGSATSTSTPTPTPTSPLHGTCLFRQRADVKARRSCHQQTLCILSARPFPALFAVLVRMLVDAGAIDDPSILESAAAEIGMWPSPDVGRHDLPFLGSVVTLDIPPHERVPLHGLSVRQTSRETDQVRRLHAYEPPASWQHALATLGPGSDIYPVYEALILGRPVIVLSHTPEQCSHLVWLLTDLIKPIPIAGPCRPYMTIQAFFEDPVLPPTYLIGTTNPLLVQTARKSALSTGHRTPLVLRIGTHTSGRAKRRSRSRMDGLFGGVSAWSKIFDPDVEGIKTDFLKPDRRLAKSLDCVFRGVIPTSSDGVDPLVLTEIIRSGTGVSDQGDISKNHAAGCLPSARPSSPTDILVRRHFAQLTAQFLAPVNRYLASSSVQSSAVASPASTYGITTFASLTNVFTSPIAAATPQASTPHSPITSTFPHHSFSAGGFLRHLSKHGSAVVFRGSTALARRAAQDEMYAAFVDSAAFSPWLESKGEAEQDRWVGVS